MSEKSNPQYPPTTKVGTKTWYALKFFLSLFYLIITLGALYLADMMVAGQSLGRYPLNNLGVLKPLWDSFLLLLLILGTVFFFYTFLKTVFAKKRLVLHGRGFLRWNFIKKD